MDLLRTFSKPFPHKETQSNGPLIPRFFRPLLCWWKNRGIGGPLLCVKNHGILYEYLTLEVISSQAIPGLFTPGIVTSTRCASYILVVVPLYFLIILPSSAHP